MDNENIAEEEELLQDAAAEAQEDNSAEIISLLRGEITDLKLRLALLSGGAASGKLGDGVRLAQGILGAGETSPEDAAAKILEEYPHLKLQQRSVPKLSAESGGKGDGFAAIRSIFAKR